MGKSSSPKTEVTQYFLSIHFGVSLPVDALTGIYIKEKLAWSGRLASMQPISLDLPDLFGGLKKEGGIQGNIYWLPGDEDQFMPEDLAQKLGRSGTPDCPAYRGLASLFFYASPNRGFYWSANNPFIPTVWAQATRTQKRVDGTEQWYPAKASIPNPQGTASGSGEPVATYNFDLNAQVNATRTLSTALAVGYTITTSSPTDILLITLPAGRTFKAYTYSSNPVKGGFNSGSANEIRAIRDDGDLPEAIEGDGFWVNLNNSAMHNGFDAAREAFGTRTMTGATKYTFYIHDSPIGDNTGGLSPRVDVISGASDMNPAHIIHECLTDTAFGMGTPLSALDDASFREAADTLFDERFGLSILWLRQTSIEAFIQEVLDHIQGVLYVDPATGLLTLKLIRGDYDEGTLPELTPDNAQLESFSRKLWGDIVNEIVVTWTNPENEQEETVTAQDLASIAMQGGVVSDSRNYYGVRNSEKAIELAWRDLRSAGQPLASAEVTVDRSLWQLRPASVVKLTWPEYSVSQLVMRVTSIEYGKPGDPTIKLSLIEDVYGLDIGTFELPPTTEWTDPSQAPIPLEVELAFTLPLFWASNSIVAAFVDSPEYPEVVAGTLASTSQSDAFQFELWDEVTLANGSLQWQRLSTSNILGRAFLDEVLPAEVTSSDVSYSGLTGTTNPTVAGFALIGDGSEQGSEIALIDSLTPSLTLLRGALDTIPRRWPAGTQIWFIDDSVLLEDPTVRAAGEVVDYKLLPRTSQGLLPLGSAAEVVATLSDRPWLPNRPADVKAATVAFSSPTQPINVIDRPDSWVTVTWANRNRLLEDAQVLAWDADSQTPEAGQTTTIEVRDQDENLLASHTGLTGTSFDVPDSDFTEPLIELRIFSERTDDDGEFVSLQYFSHWLLIESTNRITEDSVERLTEDDEIRLQEVTL